jgi:hypothetical protein
LNRLTVYNTATHIGKQQEWLASDRPLVDVQDECLPNLRSAFSQSYNKPDIAGSSDFPETRGASFVLSESN